MSTFEFDDVINTAKVIVNPEASAVELKQLRAENVKLRADNIRLKKQLEEAVTVIEIIDNLHPDFDVITDYLAADYLASHPVKP